MKPLIEVQNLKLSRGDFALELPQWSVAAGQVVGVVGNNGAGKTTLLGTLAGFWGPDSGSVRVFGMDPLHQTTKVRTRLGFMSDDMSVFDTKVGALLKMVSGYYPSWDPALVKTLTERFELDPSQRTTALSRGQGTRLRLILALAHRPQLLILDEPAAGLDLHGRRALLQSVLEVVQDPERTVLISSHMLADVERIADALLVLHHGKIIAQGPTDRLVGEHRTLEEAMTQWEARQ